METVTIPLEEYTKLLRESERLRTAREYVASREFIAPDETKALLGVEIKKGEKNA